MILRREAGSTVNHEIVEGLSPTRIRDWTSLFAYKQSNFEGQSVGEAVSVGKARHIGDGSLIVFRSSNEHRKIRETSSNATH